MPPRSSLTSSFSVSDANNEVVCPLTNNDGSNCRKRCLGEKRYRSMQEHIRRAHPSHYIPKLPATEESFQLMVNTPLDQRTHPPQSNATHPRRGPSPQPSGGRNCGPGADGFLADAGERDIFGRDGSSPVTPRTIDEAHPAAATAAVALAQLHHHRLNSDWDSEMDTHSDVDLRKERMRTSIELPPLRDHLKQESIPPFQSPRPRELLPSILSHSPPSRSSTLPPIQRREKIQRSRKGSLTQSVRKGKHERNRSRDFGRRPSLGDRKALSAEPQTAAWVQGKRWEDLIEAATSATEVGDDRDRDLTPVPHSPSFPPFTNSAASGAKHRSLPPAFQPTSGLPAPQPYRQFPPLSYSASPLQKTLTPPPYEPHHGADMELEPFPSVESSLDSASTVSGKNFHMSSAGLPKSANSDSSPVPSSRPLANTYPPSSHPQQLQNHHHHHHHSHHRVHHRQSNPTPLSSGKDLQIYCASCSRPWSLRDCFACTECICGVCKECVNVIMGSHTTTTGGPASILNPTSNPGNGVGISGNGNMSGTGRPTSMPNRRGCPSCGTLGGRWKGFQLDFR